MTERSRPRRPKAARPSFPALNAALRQAVAADRKSLNKGLLQDQRLNDYAGRWLSWPQLARLVAEKFNAVADEAWSIDRIQEVLNKGGQAPPRDFYERELFLRALQSAMNLCFDLSANYRAETEKPHPGVPHDYIVFLGQMPQLKGIDVFGFDPASIGFFKVLDWNNARSLLTENVGRVESVPGEQAQNWIPQKDLEPYLTEEFKTKGAPCPSLVGYVEDTREIENLQLILRVTDSAYWRHVAIRRYLHDHPDVYDAIASRVEESGLRDVVAGSPRSNICINVTLTSREGTLLAIKRPVGARVWANYYQFGAHETMITIQPGQDYEDCYQLARRAIDEELNLDEEDYYGQIVFSWFGYYLPEASTYFFAHLRSRLNEAEIVQKLERAKSKFEIGNVEWIKMNSRLVREVLGGWPDGPWSPRPSGGKRYLPHACLSVTQLYRIMSLGMLPGSD